MERQIMKKIALLTILGLMGSGVMAYAESPKVPNSQNTQSQGSEDQWKERFQKHQGKMFKDLGLTTEQKEKLKAQHESEKESRKAAHEQMKTKMKSLHEALGKPGVDKAQLQGLITEINALKAAEFSQHIDGILAMKSILTSEQFAKMQARFTERFGKHGGWKGQCAWKGKKSGDGKQDEDMGPPPGEPPFGMEPPPGEPPVDAEPSAVGTSTGVESSAQVQESRN